MEPSPKMQLRDRLLRLQDKLLRFKSELHPSALKFIDETTDLGTGPAENMLLRKYNLEGKKVETYKKLVGQGTLKNLLRMRANTLCNSRHFKQGVKHCPVDNQVLSVFHVTGHCAITRAWRTQAARMLQCEEKDILKTLGTRELLMKGEPEDHLRQLEAIC